MVSASGDDLTMVDIKASGGPVAGEGDEVTILYRIALSEESLRSGDLIETNYSPDTPLTVTISPDGLLEGIREGILGMTSGGSIRQLRIPSRLAFGSRGFGTVPPHSDLTVEICLISVEHNEQP